MNRKIIACSILFMCFLPAAAMPALAGDISESEELRAELPEGRDPAVSLACVSGTVTNAGPSSFVITNQRNVAVEDPAEVFSFLDNGAGSWGAACNDGWVVTDCSSARLNSPTYPDSPTFYTAEPVETASNSCRSTAAVAISDSPLLYINCCKFGTTLLPGESLGVPVEPPTAPPPASGGKKKERLALACVTATITSSNAESIAITSRKNTEITDWRDAFAFNPFTGEEDSWGLLCINDWVASGCSGSDLLLPVNGSAADKAKSKYNNPGIIFANNGCRSDDEEIWDGATLFGTCCKLQMVEDLIQ